MGDAQVCDAPQAAAWIEDAAEPEVYAEGEHAAMEPGGVALLEADETWLVWEPPNAAPEALGLTSGTRRTIGSGPVTGFGQGDLDGDGAVDLVLSGSRIVVTWGFGTADEALDVLWTSSAQQMAREAVVIDVDGDGRDDLLLGLTVPGTDDPEAFRLVWLPNQGDRTFGEPVPVWGDATRFGPVFDLSVRDLDSDGDPDVYVCNDFGREVAPNAVLTADGGGLALGDAQGLDVAASCMGVTWGDADGDGRLDAHVAASGEQLLLVGSEAGYFNGGAARGLDTFLSAQMAWGSALGDLDNDGRADLLVSTSDFYADPMLAFPLYWYHQEEDGTFADRGEVADTTTRGVITRDLNADGVPDVVVGDALRSPHRWMSTGCTADGWIEVDAPSGSLVRVRAGEDEWVALATSDVGWASSAPARAHFGLGKHDSVDSVEIEAPWQPAVTLAGPIDARRVVRWVP